MSKENSKGSPYVVPSLALIIAIPLWRELSGDSPTGLKTLMGLILAVVVIGAFLISRSLAGRWDQVGEARFDNSKPEDK